MQAVTVGEVFEKLEKRDADSVLASVLDLARSRFSRGMPVLVNFLYFANAEMRNVFEPEKRSVDDERYVSAMLEGDALLPDGIALALSYLRFSKPETNPLSILSSYRSKGDSALANLNGTDLLPNLLVRFRETF